MVALERNWTWIAPVSIRKKRRWLVGRMLWIVLSNHQSRGCNVRVVVDDETGKVAEAAFWPR